MRFFAMLILSLLLFSCNNKKSAKDELADKMYTALLNSNTEEAMKLVQQLYEKNGVIFGELEWRYKEPTEVYNYYDFFGPRIILGRMPKAGKETQEYWINWRKVLTNDGWDPAKFFNDEKEMQLMANYNIVVLIAHELGHYFEDYYDADVLQPKENVNGRELFADRFSIALTNELAKSDPRFANLKQRYLELVQSMNETVPPVNRYSNEQGKLLVAYPDSIMVSQPSFDDTKTMQPYASAFFQRHRVLLSGEIALPSLRQITDSVLWKRHHEKIAAMPYLAARLDTVNNGLWAAGHFQAFDDIIFEKGYAAAGERYGAKELSYADTFSILRMDTKGKTWNASVQSKKITGNKFQYRVVYQHSDGAEEELPGNWDNMYRMLPEHLFIKSGTDIFLVLAVLDGKKHYRALHYQKINDKWEVNDIPLASDHPIFAGAGAGQATTSCIAEDGRFILLVRTLLPGGRSEIEWYELNNETLKPGAVHQLGTIDGFNQPDGMAMAKDGSIYLESGHYIIAYKNNKWNTLFGHGIFGEAFSTDPFRISYYDAGAMAATPRSLLFIDRWRGRRYINRGEILEVRW